MYYLSICKSKKPTFALGILILSYSCLVLAGSYSACMGYLMKFPGGFDDVYRYVKTALIMRENKVKRMDDVSSQTIGLLSCEQS